MKLLLAGWEAADWKILHPLLDAGEMPALNRLVEKGASGALLSVAPAVPASQWTSLATGKRAWRHGICHSFEIPVNAGPTVPVTSRLRRAASLCEILAQEGRRCLVAGWPASHGGQTGAAKIVSDRYPEPTAPPGVKPWPPAVAGTYWPKEIGPALDKLRVSPAEVAADIVARYVPHWRKIDQKRDHRLGQLRVLLAADFSYQTAMTELMTSGPWDFAAVRFPALGAISRIFARDGMAEDELQFYRDVINSHCRMLDLMLRRLVDAAGEDTAVMVVSVPGAEQKSPYGIFAAGGPGFSTDTLVHGASALDVTPTVLTWFGLSIGDDMEGRVLIEGFSTAPDVARVASWEPSRPGPASQTLGGNSTLQHEWQWNFAESCVEAGRYEEALPVLEQMFRAFPERAENSHALFQCQLALGRLPEAEQTLEVALEALPPGVLSLLPRAELAVAKREWRQARLLVEQARQLQSAHPPAMRRLGMLLLRLREWDALSELASLALKMDETDPIAWLGLAEARLRKGDAKDAAEAARRAIGLKYFLPEAHFVLARSLVAQGNWPEARDVMQTLLSLQPNHRTAPVYLKRLRNGAN